MHLKLRRAAARVAVLGGIVTLGLGSTQAALASPTPTPVPCGNTSDLITDMTGADSGTVLILAPHCTYWLTEGLPEVMKELTIVGNGASVVRSHDAEDSFSIFKVGEEGDLTLDDVNVANGGGSDDYDGGAVYISGGTATIRGGTFSDNIVSTTEYGEGGAIGNFGTLVVDGATFSHNGGEYGGAIFSKAGGTTISGATFRQNSSYDGGAIYVLGTMTVNGSAFRQNDGSAYGGGIYNAADLTLNGDSFAANEAEYGGAIANENVITVNHTTMVMNTGYDGGAFYEESEDDTAINDSVITINRASEYGGGIYLDYGTVDLTGDTIYVNEPGNCYPVGDITGCID
jgi:predicted outer membrane repeat protein